MVTPCCSSSCFGNSRFRALLLHRIFSNAKVRALLAYLALVQPRAETRERLTNLLWGSRFDAQASQSFRQALAR